MTYIGLLESISILPKIDLLLIKQTYGVELEFRSKEVDGTNVVIHGSLHSGGAWSRRLRSGEGTGRSSKGKEGSGCLHGQLVLGV